MHLAEGPLFFVKTGTYAEHDWKRQSMHHFFQKVLKSSWKIGFCWLPNGTCALFADVIKCIETIPMC